MPVVFLDPGTNRMPGFPHADLSSLAGDVVNTQCLQAKQYQQIRLYHADKSVMAEHGINLGNCNKFQDTRILTKRRVTELEIILKSGTRKKVSP
jgi:hypothetical protein